MSNNTVDEAEENLKSPRGSPKVPYSPAFTAIVEAIVQATTVP